MGGASSETIVGAPPEQGKDPRWEWALQRRSPERERNKAGTAGTAGGGEKQAKDRGAALARAGDGVQRDRAGSSGT